MYCWLKFPLSGSVVMFLWSPCSCFHLLAFPRQQQSVGSLLTPINLFSMQIQEGNWAKSSHHLTGNPLKVSGLPFTYLTLESAESNFVPEPNCLPAHHTVNDEAESSPNYDLIARQREHVFVCVCCTFAAWGMSSVQRIQNTQCHHVMHLTHTHWYWLA